MQSLLQILILHFPDLVAEIHLNLSFVFNLVLDRVANAIDKC